MIPKMKQQQLFPLSIVPLFLCALTVWAIGPISPQYLEGTVENIKKDSIVVSQQVDPADKAVQLTFKITDRTKYKEFSVLKELEKGDVVNVKYTKERGKNIASDVVLLKHG